MILYLNPQDNNRNRTIEIGSQTRFENHLFTAANAKLMLKFSQKILRIDCVKCLPDMYKYTSMYFPRYTFHI